MRFIKSIFFTVSAVLIMSACNEDDVNFSFEELRNEEFDLAVVSDAKPYVEASFSVSGNLQSISASITLEGETEPVGTETISGFTGTSFTRINVQIPVPTPNIAPSGVYNISYSITTSDGDQDGGSYSVNVINNRPPAFCPVAESLPTGTNTWIRLYVPTASQLPDGETIYATGSFEGWTGGGNPDYAFTKVSETCYQLAVQLPSDAEVKFTRGAWSAEAQNYSKSNFSNLQTSGRSTIEISIFDWSDTDLDLTGIDPPSAGNEVPSEAIEPGKLTVTVDIGGNDPEDGSYYIVAQGETDLTNAYLMTAYENGNRLAAAVPKDAASNYIIVKDEITAVGTNAGGAIRSATWDGMTNPVDFSVSNFDGGLEQFYMTGAATDGWAGGADYPLPSVSPGVFQNTFTLQGDAGYLFLAVAGDFGTKYGRDSGDASSGTLAGPGSGGDHDTNGLATGNYTVTIDFNNDPVTYTVVPAN